MKFLNLVLCSFALKALGLSLSKTNTIDCRQFTSDTVPKFTPHTSHDDLTPINETWAYCVKKAKQPTQKKPQENGKEILMKRWAPTKTDMSQELAEKITKLSHDGFFFTKGTERDYQPRVQVKTHPEFETDRQEE